MVMCICSPIFLEDGFHVPYRYQNPEMPKSPVYNEIVFAYNLHILFYILNHLEVTGDA
jgi:hypothetical protein